MARQGNRRPKQRRTTLRTKRVPKAVHEFYVRLYWQRIIRVQHIITHRIVTGCLLICSVAGLTYSLSPVVVQPNASSATALPITSTQESQKHTTSLPHSPPTQLDIPDIGLSTAVTTTGKNADGSLAAPAQFDVAAWYTLSPTPGELGPSVIVGHLDSYHSGPAVFFNLKGLKPGQIVRVTRQDKRTVQFKVDHIALFDQDNFPTQSVYGNIDHPGLRLITCGGSFDAVKGKYRQNTVIYASYIP